MDEDNRRYLFVHPNTKQVTFATMREMSDMLSDVPCDLRCGLCGMKSKLRCGRCKLQRYCSKDCQVKDWGKHKLVCSSN